MVTPYDTTMTFDMLFRFPLEYLRLQYKGVLYELEVKPPPRGGTIDDPSAVLQPPPPPPPILTRPLLLSGAHFCVACSARSSPRIG